MRTCLSTSLRKFATQVIDRFNTINGIYQNALYFNEVLDLHTIILNKNTLSFIRFILQHMGFTHQNIYSQVYFSA